MSEDKERYSAWLDDAVEHNEVHSIAAEQNSRHFCAATRYQMIGDAMRGKMTDASMTDISVSVSAAISKEPELAPAESKRAKAAPRRESKPFWGSLGLGSWLRPVGGLAVAATVAMVMVVTLTEQPLDESSAVVANVGQQPVIAIPASNPVSYNARIAQPAVNLNTYLIQHSEHAAQDTVQGLMPYARAVSYGSGKNLPEQNSPQDKAVTNPVK